LLCALLSTRAFGVADNDSLVFDDRPLEEPLAFPEWFKLSFLDFREDLKEALDSGKDGLLVYYGQKYCAYCKQFLETDLAKEDIQAYTPAGMEMTERELAVREETNFTPSVVFYDGEGREVLRLRGYYPPYRFRAALEYVADDHYRNESFREYLGRADVPLVFEPGDLNEEPFFMQGPMMLDRSRIWGERPLVVFFEQGSCHACDVLHSGPLADPEIRQRISRLENVQLSYWSDTPVVTPAGERTSAKKWAESLGLFYTPTLIIFDEQGREIIRVDSVVQFYRLRNILDYVLTEGYRNYPNFQSWRASRNPKLYLK
jgi:thioredoxin-related protein